MHPGHKQALHKRARSHHNVFRCHVDVATLAPLCLLSLTACMSISIIAGLVQRAGHNDWNDGHDCGIPRLCLAWSGNRGLCPGGVLGCETSQGNIPVIPSGKTCDL